MMRLRSRHRLFRSTSITTNCFYGQCAKLHFQHNHIHHSFFYLSVLLVCLGVNRFERLRFLEYKGNTILLWWWYSSYSRCWRLCLCVCLYVKIELFHNFHLCCHPGCYVCSILKDSFLSSGRSFTSTCQRISACLSLNLR